MFEDARVVVAMLCIDQNSGNRKKIEFHLRINSMNESIRKKHVDCKFNVALLRGEKLFF